MMDSGKEPIRDRRNICCGRPYLTRTVILLETTRGSNG